MKLTKKEVTQVFRAAKLIEKRTEMFSCCALDTAADGVWTDLREKYAKFYEKDQDEVWFNYEKQIGSVPQEFVDARVTLLLFFAEANK